VIEKTGYLPALQVIDFIELMELAPQVGFEPTTLRVTAAPAMSRRSAMASYYVNRIKRIGRYAKDADSYVLRRFSTEGPHHFPHPSPAWPHAKLVCARQPPRPSRLAERVDERNPLEHAAVLEIFRHDDRDVRLLRRGPDQGVPE
jgi:hypothetical protein